jgi:hypothetical protein
MIHTVTSSNGGVFSVLVDGFNTTSTIDTHSGGNQNLPLCMPNQFPPLQIMPPAWAAANDTEMQHTITLVYVGISPNANSTNETTSVQFDSFAVPVFAANAQHNASNAKVTVHNAATFLVICIILPAITSFMILVVDVI